MTPTQNALTSAIVKISAHPSPITESAIPGHKCSWVVGVTKRVLPIVRTETTPDEASTPTIKDGYCLFDRQAAEVAYFNEKSRGVGAVEYVSISGRTCGVFRDVEGAHLVKEDSRGKRTKVLDLQDTSDASMASVEKALAKMSGHKLDESGRIYILSDGENSKIGATSYAVTKRVSELQVGNAKQLTLLGSYEVQSKISTESHLHTLYEDRHVRGEWFKLSQQDVYDILSARRDVINRDRFFKLTSQEVVSIRAAFMFTASEFARDMSKRMIRLQRNFGHTPAEAWASAKVRRLALASKFKEVFETENA